MGYDTPIQAINMYDANLHLIIFFAFVAVGSYLMYRIGKRILKI